MLNVCSCLSKRVYKKALQILRWNSKINSQSFRNCGQGLPFLFPVFQIFLLQLWKWLIPHDSKTKARPREVHYICKYVRIQTSVTLDCDYLYLNSETNLRTPSWLLSSGSVEWAETGHWKKGCYYSWDIVATNGISAFDQWSL